MGDHFGVHRVGYGDSQTICIANARIFLDVGLPDIDGYGVAAGRGR